MILRLWFLARMARYLAYIPILGWRFSDSIQQFVTDAIDEEIEVNTVDIELTEDAPPTSMETEIQIHNSLPTDISVTELNVRIGFAEEGKTLYNLRWTEGSGGIPMKNISTETIETSATGTVSVEQYLPWSNIPEETIHVDGNLKVKTWLDVPSTQRIPIGSVHRDIPPTRRQFNEE